MRKLSLVFYTIGLVFSYIALIVGIAGIVYGAILISKEGMEAGQNFLVPGIIVTVIYLLVIGIVKLGRRQVLKGNRNHRFFHLLVLILGIISFDIFYVLGAIFGIFARNK